MNLVHALFCACRYECIENDLLDSLQFSIHNIAPYQSKGIEKAAELTVGWSSKNCPQSNELTNGKVLDFSLPSIASCLGNHQQLHNLCILPELLEM